MKYSENKMIKFCKIFLFGIICMLNTVNAQDKQKADSLISLLKSQHIDLQDKIEIYLEIAKYETPQVGLEYAQEALLLSQESEDVTLKAKALAEIALNLRILGNLVESFYASIEALKIYEELDLIEPQAAINTQIGVLYIDNKNFKNGIKYLKRSLTIYEELKDTFNIAALNINLGEAYRLENILDSAEACFNESLEVNQTMNNDLIHAYSIGNLGMVHSSRRKFELAKNELSQAIDILVELGDPYSVAVYKSEMGHILIQEGNLTSGEDLLLESLKISKREGLKEQICDISKKLAIYYESNGQFKNALTYRKEFEIYRDSIINYENVRKIEQLRGEYEMEKKETEIEFLNKTNKIQRSIGYGLGGGFILFIVLSFFLLRLYKKSKQANRILNDQKEIIQKREDEKAILLKELNHRVKNNLQMISSLLNLQSHQLKGHPAAETLRAGKYRVEALSLVHQKLYQEDHHTKIALNEYIEELAMNLVHCFDKKVKLNLELENVETDIDTAIPLGLVINELITNSLKHAFYGQVNPTLNISAKETDNHLVVWVRDNGRGVPEENLNAKTDSFGLKLVNSLMKQLNAQLDFKNTNGCNWKISIIK